MRFCRYGDDYLRDKLLYINFARKIEIGYVRGAAQSDR